MTAILVLEDGSSYEGVSFGAGGERIGEVVLNTAVVGYQEMMTDPANAGRILVLTYPLIGNYGVAKKFNESDKCWIAGLVIKEPSRIYSNFQAEAPLDGFLKNEDVVTVSDVDTRTIAVTIRDKGEMLGIVSSKGAKKEDLLKKLRDYKEKAGTDFIKKMSVKKPVEIKGRGPRVAVLDLGMANSFIAQLKNLGCDITLLPYDTGAGDILAKKYSGVVISNGPENDESLGAVVGTVKALLGKIPLFGISTGHEVIALALGAKLERMKLGHHGCNYPVKGLDSLKGDITVQNHSYAVAESSLKNRKDVTVTLRNINDNSVEEMESKTLKFISVQYYPASPGFGEIHGAFTRFMRLMAGKAAKQARPAKSAKSAKPARQGTRANEVTYAKA